MAGMEQTGDWRKLVKTLAGLAGVDFLGLHKKIGEYQLKATKDRFEKGVSPDGKSWQPSLRVKNGGGQTLMDSRLLQQSLTYKAQTGRVDIGTPDWRAQIMNDGKTSSGSSVIKAKNKPWLVFRAGGKWYKVKQITLVARPFNGINTTDQQQIQKIITRAIEGAAGK